MYVCAFNYRKWNESICMLCVFSCLGIVIDYSFTQWTVYVRSYSLVTSYLYDLAMQTILHLMNLSCIFAMDCISLQVSTLKKYTYKTTAWHIVGTQFVKWLNNEWMHILPGRLFLPWAQETVLRILWRCFKVLFVYVFNVKAIGPCSCSRIFTIGTSPFPSSLSLITMGQADLFVLLGLPISLVRPVLFLPEENAFLSPLCLSQTYCIF